MMSEKVRHAAVLRCEAMVALILAIAVAAWLSMLVLPLLALRKRRRREAILAEQLRQWQRENTETGMRQSEPR
jgi:hypothetical protein